MRSRRGQGDGVSPLGSKNLNSRKSLRISQTSQPLSYSLVIAHKTAAAFLYKIKEILLFLEKVMKSMSLFIALYCYNL